MKANDLQLKEFRGRPSILQIQACTAGVCTHFTLSNLNGTHKLKEGPALVQVVDYTAQDERCGPLPRWYNTTLL